MMLDVRGTFDALVTRYASNPAGPRPHPQQPHLPEVSGSLAGTPEYMAMEKLYALRDDPRYDLIVLDTPPTSNALDFLDAPDKMIEAVDSPAIQAFVGAFERTGQAVAQPALQGDGQGALGPRNLHRRGLPHAGGGVSGRPPVALRRLSRAGDARARRAHAARTWPSWSSARPTRWPSARRCSSSSTSRSTRDERRGPGDEPRAPGRRPPDAQRRPPRGPALRRQHPRGGRARRVVLAGVARHGHLGAPRRLRGHPRAPRDGLGAPPRVVPTLDEDVYDLVALGHVAARLV
jgi:hypothetical protein